MVHSSRLIGSVQRAIDILNLFDNKTAELGTTDIANALNLHKSTAASLVYTLEANGYLTQNLKSHKYRLGFRLAERSAVMLNHLPIRQVAYPCLQELHDQFNETINLAILDGPDVVYVERMLSTRSGGMRSEVGRRTMAHTTALGKAILAGLSEQELNTYLVRYGLPALTPKTVTDPVEFKKLLEKFRDQGYSEDDEENEPGGRCVASPIFNQAGSPVAAISISMPLVRLDPVDFPKYGARVREAARAVSRNLGYQYHGF